MFKKVHKSYEILSNPIARQTYDIENRINDGGQMGGGGSSAMYEDTFTKRQYY